MTHDADHQVFSMAKAMVADAHCPGAGIDAARFPAGKPNPRNMSCTLWSRLRCVKPPVTGLRTITSTPRTLQHDILLPIGLNS